MNFKELARNLEMEEDEFWEMMELFLETSTSDLSHLRLAQEKGDATEAVKAAHSIKGAASNLGLMEIFQLAKSIETEARESHLDRTHPWILILGEKLNQMGEDLKGRRHRDE